MTQTTSKPVASLDETREALAREWKAKAPATPEDILAFYRDAEAIGDDLHAWHATSARQKWTEIVTYVARQIEAKIVVDIGCGAGYELKALRDLNIDTLLPIGVEPNRRLRAGLIRDGYSVAASIDEIDVANVDMFVCLDVLEHVVDPDTFLSNIATQARLGAVLVESTATFDCSTPLHLKDNRGWHPGNCLERHGWIILDERGRVRVWQRTKTAAELKAGALLCAYRSCAIPTMTSILKLRDAGWDVRTKCGDGLISRARSIIVSRWYLETAEDVFLMIDDDVVFEPEDAQRLVEECRNGHDIICAAYPIRDGAHLAIATLNANDIHFALGEPPIEIRYAATGFMAVHRKVIDALWDTLPLCHANQSHAFKAMFQPFTIDEVDPVEHVYLSEDWAFCQKAIDVGFKVWLDPSIKLGHIAQVEVDVQNMKLVNQAHKLRVGENEVESDA